MASAIARRLGITAASKPAIAILASSVSRRFASARVHNIVASRVARGIGSAVTKKLIESGKLNLDSMASGIARRVSAASAAAAELPVVEESAKKKS